MFNIPKNAIKTLDALFNSFQDELIDPIENSIKNVKKNFKANSYLSVATIFFLIGSSLVLSKSFQDQFFIQAMIYFSYALFTVLIFILIIWRILK